MSDSPRHWRRYLLALTTVILLTAGSTAYAVIAQFQCALDGNCGGGASQSDDGLGGTFDGGGIFPEVPAGSPQTLLLIGSDGRSARSTDGAIGQRSDTMMLVHLDPSKPTTVMSIPRDTRAKIPAKNGGTITAKINVSFANGGPVLTYRTVRNLLGITPSHVAVINFEAFQRAVNRLNCLYQDIDRTYFNNNTGPGGYAAIDVKSGYQLLCGSDTLDWVRYRHTDSDLVRGARQQAFLRSAKNQVAASRLFRDRNELIRIVRHYTQIDIKTADVLVGLMKLLYESSKQPMRSVPFIANDARDGSGDLIVTPAAAKEMRTRFLGGGVAAGSTSITPTTPSATTPTTPAPKKKPKKKKKARKPKQRAGLASGLIKVSNAGSQALQTATFNLAGTDLPLYAPTVRYAQGGWANTDPVRVYKIKAGRYSKRSYQAYRMTWATGNTGSMLGQYYGLQGTTWKDAPILRGRHYSVTRRGRSLDVYLAGGRPQLVAWQTPKAVYWVSNTVSLAFTTSQLVDIAASLQRVG